MYECCLVGLTGLCAKRVFVLRLSVLRRRENGLEYLPIRIGLGLHVDFDKVADDFVILRFSLNLPESRSGCPFMTDRAAGDSLWRGCHQ